MSGMDSFPCRFPASPGPVFPWSHYAADVGLPRCASDNSLGVGARLAAVSRIVCCAIFQGLRGKFCFRERRIT